MRVGVLIARDKCTRNCSGGGTSLQLNLVHDTFLDAKQSRVSLRDLQRRKLLATANWDPGLHHAMRLAFWHTRIKVAWLLV